MEISNKTSVISSRHRDKRLVFIQTKDMKLSRVHSREKRVPFCLRILMRPKGNIRHAILFVINHTANTRRILFFFFSFTMGIAYLFPLFSLSSLVSFFLIIPAARRFVAKVTISLSYSSLVWENISNKPSRYVIVGR